MPTTDKRPITQSAWNDHRILFLLVFVTFVSVLLGFRSEVNAHNILHQQHQQDLAAIDLQARVVVRQQKDYTICLATAQQLNAQASFAREFYHEELAGPIPVGPGGAQLKAARLSSAKKLLNASHPLACVKP